MRASRDGAGHTQVQHMKNLLSTGFCGRVVAHEFKLLVKDFHRILAAI